MALRILITNITLWPPSGTVLYVRDLALELKRQGHVPAVFSSTRGPVADELREAGVAVADRIAKLERPDVIHAHHRAPALIALRRWPDVPAIYVCHDHASPFDAPPLHPSVRRYFGVSRLCLERLRDAGVPRRTGLLLNFVDTARFRPREGLPPRPRRALVLSNYAHARTHLPAVVEACRQAGVDLEVVGAGVDRIVASPERLLLNYDLVFAKAKAAIEALAVGNAVVLCDSTGVGPMVTTENLDELRPLNFGFEALAEPLEAGPLVREIARYDAADAARVRDRIRADASLVATVEEIIGIYLEVLAEQLASVGTGPRTRAGPPPLRESAFLRLYWTWQRIPRRRRHRLMSLPGSRAVRAVLRRLG